MSMALGTKRPVNDINVTPLIDVVLVLLIIFMVLTPLAEKQMFMRVPEFEPEAQPVPPEMVPPDQTVMLLRANGSVLLNNQEKTLDETMVYLNQAFENRGSKPLFFNAEDGVKYEQVVHVLDLAHQAGVNTIGLMTDAPDEAALAAPGGPGEAPAPVAPAPAAPAPTP